jgi:hypothetical protein
VSVGWLPFIMWLRGSKVKTLLPFEAVGLRFATLQSLHKDSYCGKSYVADFL